MHARPRKSPPSNRRKQAPEPVRCRALVLSDTAKIRRRALANCRLASDTFRKAERELEDFEAKDKPAYLRWYRAEFGPKIEALKTNVDEINAMHDRMARLSRFAELKRCRLHEATRMFEQSREEFDRIEACLLEQAAREEEEARRREEADFQAMKKDLLKELAGFLKDNRHRIQKRLKRGEYKIDILDEMLMVIEMQTGVPEPLMRQVLRQPEAEAALKAAGLDGALDEDGEDWEDDDEWLDDDPFDTLFGDPFDDTPREEVRQSASSRPADHEARIKVLWRELAFALHPDQSNSASDPAKLDLWHQVQEAMSARDLDRLEVLHARLQVMTGELGPQTPVSRIMALTEMYRESRNALRRRIRDLRKSREWGFAAVNEERRRRLRALLDGELDRDLRQTQRDLAALRAQYQRDFFSQNNKKTRPKPFATPSGQMNFADWT